MLMKIASALAEEPTIDTNWLMASNLHQLNLFKASVENVKENLSKHPEA